MPSFFRGSKSASSNSRCSVLLREVTAFSQSLQHMHKGLRTLTAEAELAQQAALESTKVVLSSSLPRHVFEEAAAGALPEAVGGSGFNGEQVALVKTELGARMQLDVFEPLAVWNAAYNSVVGQQRAVDKLEKERDVQARKVNKLRSKVDKLRLKQGRSASPKVAQNLEEVMRRLQVREGQLAVASKRHDEEEAQQYARLALLISDAKFLRHYVKKALQQVADALHQASGCVEDTAPAAAAPQEVATAAGAAMDDAALALTTPTLSPLRLNTLKGAGTPQLASSGAPSPQEGGTPRASEVPPANPVSFAHAKPLPTAEEVAAEVVAEQEGAEASPYAEILDRLAEGVPLPTTPGRV